MFQRLSVSVMRHNQCRRRRQCGHPEHLFTLCVCVLVSQFVLRGRPEPSSRGGCWISKPQRLHSTALRSSAFKGSASEEASSAPVSAGSSGGLQSGPPGPGGSGPSPEAWREFRAQLISGGLKLTTQDEEEEVTVRKPNSQDVAPKNVELLRQQNKRLWREYVSGVWAHISPVEVGGLVCRLPLQAQLVGLMRDRAPGESSWGDKLRERLCAELPSEEKGVSRSRAELYESWSRNTNYCYKIAESLIDEVLQEIVSKTVDGRVEIAKLSEEERSFLVMYGSVQDSWQSVCLVLRASSMTQAEEAIAINRPCAFRMDLGLAEVLLNGQGSAATGRYDESMIACCARAFGDSAAVYLGGPKGREEPAVLVHGFAGLAGAEEISTGTRVYVGGVEAAIAGVLAGTFSPLDFRWFIGRHQDLSIESCEWRAMACARPVVLKQCLGLPKPLWHEVMELCGGESKELSRLEILKRGDLDEDETT